MMINKDTIFDFKTHKKYFIDYLEVVIFKDGHIEYAVPSHQLKLIDIYCKENYITEDQLYDLIPISDSPTSWLIFNSGNISVWWNMVIMPPNITKEQEDALKKLESEECISPDYIKYFVSRNSFGNLVTNIITDKKEVNI